MPKLFDVRIRTTAEGLPTVLQVLDGTADLLEVKQVEATLPTGKTFRYTGGKHNKGITGEKLFDQFLEGANAKFGASRVVKLFESKGFSPKSASPVLSKAMKAGKIRKLGGGFYEKV